MRVLANHQMDHTQDKFHESLCVGNEMRLICRERIFFVSFSHGLQRRDLYGDFQDAAPKELSTMSGDIQRCLRMISDPLQYEFTLLIFMHYQQMTQDSMGYYNFLQESENDPEMKAKVEILKMLQKLKDDQEKEENPEPLIDQLNRDTLVERINMVHKSKHSFETYLNLLNNWAGTDLSVKRTTSEYADNLLNSISFDEE